MSEPRPVERERELVREIDGEKTVKFERPERRRTYHFPGGDRVDVFDVCEIIVRPSGTHRLRTTQGGSWIIPTGWIAIDLDIDEWTF